MTSEEALNILLYGSNNNVSFKDFFEAREKIEKYLDVLNILKKNIYYDNKNHVIKMKEIRKSTFNFNYEDLKEWIEDESNKNKSGDSKS